MKKIFYSIIAAAAILTGCNRELIIQEGTGSLSLDLDCKMDYTDVETRASKTDDEIINALSIDIVRPFDGWKVNYTPFSEIRGKVVELGSGSYVLTASSQEKKDAAFDQPIFEGKKNFDIKTGEVTTIDLTCKISNAMVTVKLSENFVKELSDYTVTVTNGKGSLSWNKNAEVNDFEPAADGGKTVYKAKKAGYFTLAPLTVTVDGHRVIDGTEAKTVYVIDDVKAADNHILNLDANVIGSLGGLTITISQDVKPIDQTVVVPGFEEKPVPGDGPTEDDGDDTGDDNTGGDNTGGDVPVDPAPSTAPTLIWEANPSFAPMLIDEKLDANLVINAPGKIATFVVTVDSPQLSPTIAAMCWYGDGDDETGKDTYDFEAENPAPADMDMINDQVLVENLTGMDLGLVLGEDILGKESIPFSLSGLIPMINLYEPASGTQHKFTLNVTDENGDSLEQLVIFVTK